MAHRKLAIFRRRMFTALSVLSLLLCVATLALWVRSYWRYDAIVHRWHVAGELETRALQSVLGDVTLSQATESSVLASRLQPGWRYHTLVAHPSQTLRSPAARSFLGFGFVSRTFQDSEITNRFRGIWFPHWFLALLLAILPALHLRALIRSRRLRRAGHCPRCGYDLRATPERCPECGFTTENTETTEAGRDGSLATNEHK